MGDYRQCRAYMDDVPVVINEPNMPHNLDVVPNIQFYHRSGWTEVLNMIRNWAERDSRQTAYVEDYYNHIEMPHTNSTWDKALVMYVDVMNHIGYDNKFSSDATDSITRGGGSRMHTLKALYDYAGIPNYYALVRRVTAPRNIENLPSLRDDGHDLYLIVETEKGPAYIETDVANFKPFDYLKPSLQNSLVIPIEPGISQFTSRTDSVEDMLYHYDCDFEIQADGSAKAKLVEGGTNAVDLRIYLGKLKKDKEKLLQFVETLLTSRYGQVKVTKLKPKNVSKLIASTQLESHFDIAVLANVSGNELHIMRPYKADLVSSYAPLSPNERKYPVAIHEGTMSAPTMIYHAPKGYRWDKAMLKDASIKSRFGKYTRKVKIDDETLEIREQIELGPQYIELKDYAEFRDFCASVDEVQRVELRARKK